MKQNDYLGYEYNISYNLQSRMMYDSNSEFLPRNNTKSYKNKIPHLYSLMVCIGSFYFGIMIVYFGILSNRCIGWELRKQDYWCNWFNTLQGTTMLLGVVIGVLFISRYLITALSRTKSLAVGCVLGIIGTSIMLIQVIIIHDYENKDLKYCGLYKLPQVYIGRFFEGLAVGVFTVLCPLFIYEISPLERKIFIGGFFQLSIEIGLIFTSVMRLLDESNHLFQEISFKPISSLIITLVCAIASLILLLIGCFVFLKQTPKYLLSVGKPQQARSLIESIYKQEYSSEIFLDKEAEHNYQQQISENSQMEAFDNKDIQQKCLLLGFYIMILQQASGINVINMGAITSQDIIHGFSQYATSFLFFIQLLGTITFLFLNTVCKVKKMSERKFLVKMGTLVILIIHIALLLISILGQYLSASILFRTDNLIKYILTCFFMFVFGLTLGPVIWLYVPEIMEAKEITKSIAMNWGFNTFIVWITILNEYIWESQRDRDQSQSHEENWKISIASESIIIVLLLFYVLGNRTGMVIETKNKTRLEIIRTINSTKIPKAIVNCAKCC